MRVGVHVLRKNLASLLALVEAGEPVEVMRMGKVIAVIVRPKAASQDQRIAGAAREFVRKVEGIEGEE